MSKVLVRTCDGRKALIECDVGARVAGLKKLVWAQLVSCESTEIRLLRGRKQVNDDELVADVADRGELVVVELVAVAKAPQTKTSAATLEDVAKATGGELPRAVATVVAPGAAPEEVQNRIRGFMNSLFMGGDDENDDAAENAVPEGDQDQEQEQAQEERDQPVDEAAVVMLTGMGFSGNAARKALILCGGENTERAMDWILEHAGDATIDEPITETELAAGRARREQERRQGPRRGAPARFLPDQDVAARLVDMGFAADQVAEALRVTRNDENAAVAYLLGEGPRAPGGAEEGAGGENEDDDEEGPGMNVLANPMLRALLTHPGIQEGLRNPRVLEAFRQIMADPGAARNLLADPEVGPVLLQVNRVLQMGQQQDEEEEEENNN